MLNTDFYKRLDSELATIIEEDISNPIFTHKDKEKNKPLALLMWFLKFYGQTHAYAKYIVDGDGDNSCDIILDINDVNKGKVYYIVQVKWNSEKNSKCGKIDSKQFKATLEDFKLILAGEKAATKNENFNRQNKKLQKHIEQNGLVKFIYLTLCNDNPSIADSIASFEENYQSSIEILDINRIKRDFIDARYKKIIHNNPLENYEEPIDDIKLNIEQLDVKSNYLKINSPFKAYILLLRPKTIFELFEKHSFKLFFKNVRNPLLHSKVNENIETTLKTEIPYFWYFNNGITALTNYIPDRINPTAKSITVSGFQVINGAQTVYSVYKSYKEAKPRDRRIMNNEALLTLRLLVVNSEDLSLKITRFTNSQNPMEDRDFWANDEVQIRLQQESFETSFWYEKRRGEFRDVPSNISVIPSAIFAMYHLAFNLQKPNTACQAFLADKDLFFISRKEDKDGLYEDIFLENEKPLSFVDMLVAYLFGEIVRPCILRFSEDTLDIEEIAASNFLQTITLAKILLEKYVAYKYKSNKVNITKYIIDKSEKEKETFIKIAGYTNQLTYDFLGIHDDTLTDFEKYEKFNKFVTNPTKFEMVKEYFEELKVDEKMCEEIEEIETTTWKDKIRKQFLEKMNEEEAKNKQ